MRAARRVGATALAATMAATAAGAVGSAPAGARVPPWPAVTAALPSGFLRPATVSTDTYLSRLEARLDRRVRASALGRNVAVRVVDLTSGKAVYDHRGQIPMVPASTQKTATALAVLSARGPEYRMSTRVALGPDRTRLTIVGGGDPLLDSTDVGELAAAAAERVRAAGLGATRFSVAYDDSLFARPTLPAGWWRSYPGSYVANPTSLTRYGATSADSAKDTGRLFRSRLKAAGLKVRARVKDADTPPGSSTVADVPGHTVAEALWPLLQNSDNTIAEIMIRHVALARGVPPTTTGAAAAVRAELARRGVPMASARIVDGSGLSRSDRLSAATLADITRAAVNPTLPGLSTGFRTSAYPLAGISGTLESRFDSAKTRCAAGRVLAKTGTLSDVVALSGIASSSDGRLRAFAVVVNDKPSWASLDTTRYRVDRIATAVTGCR